jgi:hypothetical protein
MGGSRVIIVLPHVMLVKIGVLMPSEPKFILVLLVQLAVEPPTLPLGSRTSNIGFVIVPFLQVTVGLGTPLVLVLLGASVPPIT